MKATFKKTIRAFTLAGVAWALIAALAGVLTQTQIFLQWPSSASILNYGHLKPILNVSIIYGAGLSLALGLGYFLLHIQPGNSLKWEIAAQIGFLIHQLSVIFGVVAILSGGNNGREFGELPWVSSDLLVLSLIIFVVMATVAMKGIFHPGRPVVLIMVAAIGGIIAYTLGNFGQPYTLFSSAPLFSGYQDNAVQEFLRSGVYAFFIVAPVFAALFYFIPAGHRVGLYSSSSSDILAMGLLILAPLAGSANLAYNHTPLISQSIGLVASFALTVVILIGYINVQNTKKSGEASNDPMLRYLQWGALLVLVFAVLRSVSQINFIQKFLGYTWWNMNDLSVDMMTYGMIILTASAILIMKKIGGSNDTPSLASIQFLLLLVGTALILLGNLAGGIAEGVNEAALSVKDWSGVVHAGSVAGNPLLSLHVLTLLGYLAILGGAALAALNVATQKVSD